MRICIYGAGAGGGHFAVKLARAGHDVSAVARGAHLAAIRDNGLLLEQGDQQLGARIAASERPEDLGPQDVVIVTVKATGLPAIADRLSPLLTPDTLVVFAQNGMPWWYPHGLPAGKPLPPSIPIFELGATFLRQFDIRQAAGAIIYSANDVIRPGVIRNNSPTANKLEVCEVSREGAAAVAALRSALVDSGIASPPVADIRASVWAKLVVNASMSTIALITGNPSAIRIDDSCRAMFERCAQEVLRVAEAHGYPVDVVVDLDVWRKRKVDHKPSMLQDFEQGRPMEVGEIILAPVAFARSAGIATPTLDVIAALACRLAADKGLFGAPA